MALLDTTMAVAVHVVTDHEGSFELEAPRPGEYYVVATIVAYRRAVVIWTKWGRSP